MSKFQNFIFEDYSLEEATKTLTLKYSLDSQLNFTETYQFNFDFYKTMNTEALDRAFQSLFFMAGVSYYKTYMPSGIEIKKGYLDQASADFFSKTYQKGLGEFLYVNKLSPNTVIVFPTNSDSTLNMLSNEGEGQLSGIGGGKDSLVSIELLKNQPKVATWSLSHRSQLEPLVQTIGTKHFWVERQWDRQLLELNKQGALNGHIPISAIFACVGTIVALLSGYQDNVVSNESSASEPNLHYQGVAINHQYSKSLEFEKDYQQYLSHCFGDNLRYYSLLRPLSEVRIAELFSKIGFNKYKRVFSSCNRAFIHSSDKIFWCGECPKCAFTFLILTPFVEQQELETLFGGKNLLLTNELESTYRQLLGIEGHKPLDCVGEVKESRAAMKLAQAKYPELNKYVFDLPEDYDYKKLGPNSIPEEIFKIVESVFNS